MSDYKRKFDQQESPFIDDIKKAEGKFAGNKLLMPQRIVQGSKVVLKNSISIDDMVDDNKDFKAGKTNRKIDGKEEPMSLAYWANVYMGNSQIFVHAQESLPEIYSVKNINLIIFMGRINIRIGDQDEKIYSPGNVIDVPRRTKMKIKNMSSDKTAILIMKL